MLSPRWRKVARDLNGDAPRVALVALSIAVGVVAVAVIAGSRTVLTRELTANYQAINPAHIIVIPDMTREGPPFDDGLVESVRRIEGVREAEGRRADLSVRARVGDAWRDLRLTAIPDFDAMRIDVIRPAGGAWPPPPNEALIERASLDWLGARVGDRLVIRTAGGLERELRLAGLAADILRPSPAVGEPAAAYISTATLAWLGVPTAYTQVLARVDGDPTDRAQLERVAARVRERIVASGRPAGFIQTRPAGEHPASAEIEPYLAVMGGMSLLALLLSGLLVVNAISALLARQTRQIGIMKALGGRTGQIAGLYLGMVLAIGLLALALALPLSALGVAAFVRVVAGLANIDVAGIALPPEIVALEVALCLAAPTLAALYPVLAGAGVTVREAIGSYGLDSGSGAHIRPDGVGRLDRALAGLRLPAGVPRPVLLALRHCLRRRRRLLLTLITLTTSGLLCLAVLSLDASQRRRIDDDLAAYGYDAEITLSGLARAEDAVREALRAPGIVAAEGWLFGVSRVAGADVTRRDSLSFAALPAATSLLKVTVLDGRWLRPDDQQAIVVDSRMLRDFPDIAVGGELTLTFKQRPSTWRVVGLIQTGGYVGAYVNLPGFTRIVGDEGHISSLFLVADQHDAAAQARLASEAEARLEQAGIRVYRTETVGALRADQARGLEVVLAFLMSIAVVAGLVGALGLVGTLSINVVERTREFGVLRAIGASDGAIGQIVAVEALLIGLLSWLLAALLALPVGKLFVDAVGAMTHSPLPYRFASEGLLLWLGVALSLALLASLLPARAAARLSVRDALAYE